MCAYLSKWSCDCVYKNTLIQAFEVGDISNSYIDKGYPGNALLSGTF